jgi:serine/threonine-protein kinase
VEVPEQARVIAGRYELESLIGEGGMAAVWRARDATLERPVAVKLLFARDERDKQRLVNQFLREARIAASVHHRNVIHIVDFGTTDEQQPFMVMELLEGETLGHRMHRDPPLGLAEVVHVASLTLRGLAAVHDAGIIHRDLKPDNVYLARDRAGGVFPKILDFGISRSMEPRSGRRSALTTRDGMIVGTPEYMSPEQARGVRTIDKRTDIYSMGCILYEALTGVLPFECENVGDLIIQIVTGSATPIHELTPTVSKPISDVVAKAMARSPDDRFQDAVEMQNALIAAAEETLDVPIAATLSDSPPSIEAAPVTVSSDRLRTLEFAIDGEPDATVGGGALPHNLRDVSSTRPTLDIEPLAITGARRARRISAAAIALCAVAAAAWGFWPSAQEPTDLGSAASASARPAPVVAAPIPPAAVAAKSTIAVQLRNVPAGSDVTVDGMPAQGNPLQLARDGRNRLIKVAARDKAPWQVVHHASSDASYDVWLAPAQAASPSTAASPTRRAASAPVRRKTAKRPPSALRKLDF